ncbi:MAG: hypothetical protein Q7U15_12365 [Methylotenera sp.]|nr:hypothetical protein [Methylotenera sp.]
MIDMSDFCSGSAPSDDDFFMANELLGKAGALIRNELERGFVDMNEPLKQKIEAENKSILNNPDLAIGLVRIAQKNVFAIELLEQKFITNRLLENISNGLNDLAESIDYAGAKSTGFWMQSDLAAIDKAKELGVNILPEYSTADLRYKIDCAIHEVL